MTVLRGLVRVWDRFNDAVMVLAGILFWGQMVIVNIEVVSRYLGRPTTWVAEISSILVLWIPFMIAGWVLRREGHVKMDLLVERLSPGLQAMINFVTSLVGFFVMLLVAVVGWMTTLSWLGNKTPTVLMLPRSPIIAIIFIGSLLFSIQFLVRAFDHLALWKKERAIGREHLQERSPNSGEQRGAR
ncbi:MAG: TRAP transporter small permease [Desulfobacteraceae bacterium]|nr:MAG: TRAP transporter small permease [Desulfobacteraceae bacterium]